MSDYYAVKLTDQSGETFSLDVTAGAWTIHIDASWPVEIQEEFDNLTRRINARRDNLPLKDESGEYIRDYDYFEYWTAYDADNELQPVRHMTEYEIEDEVAFAKAVYEYYKDLDDCLYWNLAIRDGTNEYTARLEPGGWYNNQTDSYHFVVTSEHKRIRRDNLAEVTMFVEDFFGDREQ